MALHRPLRTTLLCCSVLLASACSNGAQEREADGSSAGEEAGANAPVDPLDAGSASRVDAIFGSDRPRYGELNPVQALRMIDVEEDAPFYMVNFVKFRERADYLDGRDTELTGAGAGALYAPLEYLHEIGAEVVFVAQVGTNLPLGDGTQWDQVAIVHYPSRALFLEMIQKEEFRERAVHKEAGVEKTIAMVTERIDTGLPDGYQPPEPAYPPTAEDPPFEMVHLLDFYDMAQYEPGSSEAPRTGREAMALYQRNAGSVAAPMGVYPSAWFAVEGVLVGDGREWEEVRLNHFPSHATFSALTGDPRWLEGQHHRDAALEDTYALQTLPIINTFSR
jgi:hypothetical protein